MRRFVFPLAVSLCLLVVVSQHTPVAAKDTWISVRTKNFFLVGNDSEKELKKVGLKLEQFREVFTRLFPLMKFNTPVPTTIVVFKSQSSYRPFRVRENNAGYFQAGPDVNYIALTTETQGGQDAFPIIFHEYTHLLVKNTFSNAPVWFNEGLAEYYSTFRISDDQKIELGLANGNHVFLLREKKMLPLQTLFEVDHKSPHYNEKNKTSIFYAQSWALMHYLILGNPGSTSKTKELGLFMELLNSKVPMQQAFERAFKMPFEAMEKDLRNYIKQDRYSVVRGHFQKKLELDAEFEVKTLTEAEAQTYLGDLLLHSNRPDAYTYLQKALKLDPDLTMAHASLGMAYFREGKIKEAHASLERAVARDSQNYLAHYYYAFTLSRSGPDEAALMSEYPPATIAKIREHLKKAIALRPDYPESYNLLAFVSLVTKQDIDESIASMKKVLATSPGRHEFIHMLGQLYLQKGDYKAAREQLEVLIKSDAQDGLRLHAEKLLQHITAYEQHAAEFEKTKQSSSGVSGPGAFGPDSTQTSQANRDDPSVYLREVLRKPVLGETQLQGILTKIECEAKGLVFVIQTSAGLLRLRTATFDDITLTTYDPKVNGEISCGARKPENVVVICYLPGPDKKAKIDGVLKSIEFVPNDFKLKPGP